MAGTGTLTLLFTDLVGSTESLLALGEDRYDSVRDEHDALVGGTITDHNGEIVKHMGDGFMAVFRRATDAVGAAAEIQRLLAGRNSGSEVELGVRIGISAGDVTERPGDYHGVTVVEASRLCAAATGGQILASETVHALVRSRGGHEFVALGDLDLKGLPPLAAVAVRWGDDAPVSAPARDAKRNLLASVPLPVRLAPTEAAFVGREPERARLDAAYDAVRAGEARRVVLVAGEPGIGKTTLAARFARAAHDEAAVVLYGHCDEGLGIPYQPWGEVLTHLVRHLPEGLLDAHVAARGGELRRHVPVLAERVDAPVPASSDPEAERYLLFAAVVDLLARASSDVPVVLVLEDLHWADTPTVQLLRYVVGAEAPLQVLVVATFRDSDISEDHPLAAALAALHREPGVERITLDGLHPDDLAALLEGTGHALDADGMALRDALMAETDGNPFFVTEVLRDLRRSGDIRVAEGHTAARRDAGLQVPASVRDMIVQRAARLGDDSRRLLSAASVIGRDFDIDLVAAVCDLDVLTALDAIDAASAAALVQPADGGADRYTFVHALTAQALLDTLSAARRQRIHARVATSLEAACGDDPGERIGELARHWLAAGHRPDKAVDSACRAGQHALAHLAPEDALRWYRQALEILDRTGEPDDPRRGALLVGLGDAQRQSGDPTHRETLLAAAALADRLGDTDLLVRAVVANSRGMSSSFAAQVDNDRIAALEAAWAATEGQPTPERALVLATLAAELAFADRDRMRLLANEAIALAHRLGDDPTLVTVTTRMEAAVSAPDTLVQRCALANEAIAAAERTGDPVLRWYAAAMNCTPALESGDIETFHRRLDVVQLLAHEIGQPHMLYVSTLGQSLREALAGRLDEAEQTSARALEIGVNSGQPDAFAVCGSQLMTIRHHQGRITELMDLIEQSVADNPGFPGRRASLANCYCEAGRVADARPLLEADTADGFNAFAFDNLWTAGMTVYARVAAVAGDQRAASRLVELLDPWRDQVATTGVVVLGSLAHPLGLALATAGRLDEAEDAFAQGAAVNERLGAPVLLAETHLELARLLRRRDCGSDRTRASELAHAAHTTAAELGARSIERGAGELLDRDGDRSLL